MERKEEFWKEWPEGEEGRVVVDQYGSRCDSLGCGRSVSFFSSAGYVHHRRRDRGGRMKLQSVVYGGGKSS